jgi:DNA-binding transcriptional LysR family regulator
VLDQVVAVLAELRPQTPLDVEFAASVELLAALRRRELDLTVALLPLRDADLRMLPLGRYRFGVVVNDHDELAQRTELTAEDLAGRRGVLMVASVQPAATEAIVGWPSRACAVIEELPDADLARLAQLARHGRGVTLTGSTGAAAQIFTQPGLTAVPSRDTGPRVELGLVWRADADACRSPKSSGRD